MTEPMSDEALAGIDARVEAATLGPWEVGVSYGMAGINDGSDPTWTPPPGIAPGTCFYCGRLDMPLIGTVADDGRNYHQHRFPPSTADWETITSAATHTPITGTTNYDSGGVCSSPADAAFIAAARTDVPQLLAEVRWLRAEIARWETGDECYHCGSVAHPAAPSGEA